MWPLVAPFANAVQLPLEESNAELVPGAFRSINWNGVLLPSVVAMFINMP